MATPAFILITCIAVWLFLAGTSGQGKIIPLYLVWCSGIAGLSYFDFFTDTRSLPPRMLLIIAPASIFVCYAYRELRRVTLKTNYLLALHCLRVFVELILYRLFLNGEVPEAMTFSGWNFDIATGISAILLLVFSILKIKLPAKLFKFWNIAGLLLLAAIVITAILSAPSPFQLVAFDQPNLALLQFPYTLLPALVVPLMLLSHLLLLKQNPSGNRF